MLPCLFYKKKRHCKAAESTKSHAQKKVKRPDLTQKTLNSGLRINLRVVQGLKKIKLCHFIRRRKTRGSRREGGIKRQSQLHGVCFSICKYMTWWPALHIKHECRVYTEEHNSHLTHASSLRELDKDRCWQKYILVFYNFYFISPF